MMELSSAWMSIELRGCAGYLAFCCKAMIPIVTMGSSFSVRLDNPDCKGPLLLQFSCCLAKHPSSDFRLRLYSINDRRCSKHKLWELRLVACPGMLACMVLEHARAYPCYANAHINPLDGIFAVTHLYCRSLLANLRELSLSNLAVPLPALQQVATRLQALDLRGCRLQGSADGFLTTGWTALTSLSLHSFTDAEDNMCSALHLPALEVGNICNFDHGGGMLQLSQLSGSCLQISRLEMQCSLARPSEAIEQQSGLLNMTRLADLHIWDTPLHTDRSLHLDLGLPASLTRLDLYGCLCDGHSCMDLSWVLLQAGKCIRRGAQLHTLVSNTAEPLLQPAPLPPRWRATFKEQFRHLGGQLNGLKDLEVWGNSFDTLSAVSAVASSAPSLTRLVCNNRNMLHPIR